MALVFLAVFTVLVLLAAVFGEQGLLKVRQLKKEQQNLEERIAVLDEETERLRRQVQSMQSDPFPYEKAARERLGLVKPGEIIYDFRTDSPEREP